MLYICMEYCKHLDLGTYLKTCGILPEETAKTIAVQVIHGLQCMHDNEIAHRDLKPAVRAQQELHLGCSLNSFLEHLDTP